MARALGRTAGSLACSERTLRRYINDGLLRGRALKRRRLELPASEERYLREHWPLLRTLRAALRTERDVRMAVLFGSTAIGVDTERSDVDLLVWPRREAGLSLAPLRARLEDALDRRVHLVNIDDARRSPALMADVLAEGRVVVDRDHCWPVLVAEREDVLAHAARQDAETLAEARAVLVGAQARTER
ncbi:MAG: nucleotidyltransferase domain-containing protein [Solirubrobacteraceae bacterium]